jgi:hypothetical protein
MEILKPEVETAIEEGARGIENGSTAECEGGSMTRASVVAVRMWTGGPLRQMAATKVSSTFIPYAKTINGCHFAGRYVCDGCQEPCGGISLSDVGKISGNRPRGWLCDSCKAGKTRQPRQTRTQEQRQAVIHRLAAARRDRSATVRVQGKEDVEICNAVTAVAADVNPAQEVYGIM